MAQRKLAIEKRQESNAVQLESVEERMRKEVNGGQQQQAAQVRG